MKKRITQIENEYANLWYYPETGIIHHQFLKPISSQEFQSVLMTGLELMKKHGAQKWLSDDRLNSVLPPEDYDWSVVYWEPLAIAAGWRYWAVLPPIKTRGKINMNRITDGVDSRRRVHVEIFTDFDPAWQWLVEQGNSEVRNK
ncbi:MAG: hypothetical protein ABW124_16535 [Candidatus Thiodiazotropha sp. 6PLUC9]